MTGHDAGARWPTALLAATALAGVLVAWSAVFAAPDLALQLQTVGGGLTPRQAQLELVAAQAQAAAPDAADVLLLSSDADDAAFVRYLVYPADVRLAGTRQASAVRAALEVLPAGALVVVSAHAGRERLEDVDALARGTSPRLQAVARAGAEVVVYRVLR